MRRIVGWLLAGVVAGLVAGDALVRSNRSIDGARDAAVLAVWFTAAGGGLLLAGSLLTALLRGVVGLLARRGRARLTVASGTTARGTNRGRTNAGGTVASGVAAGLVFAGIAAVVHAPAELMRGRLAGLWAWAIGFVIAGLLLAWFESRVASWLARRVGNSGVVYFGARFGAPLLALLLLVDATWHARRATPPAAEPFVAATTARRVFLIGVDGAEWRRLTPLIEKGQLPTFAKLVQEGVRDRKSVV